LNGEPRRSQVNGASLRILAGLAIGLALGTMLAGTPEGETASAIAAPVGKLWLDGLTMTVVPLVFALLVSGIMGAASQARGGTLAARAFGWFAALLLAASLLSAAVSILAIAAIPLPEAAAALAGSVVEGPALPAAANWLDSIVPTNVVKAAADSAMVPLVIFAVLFGIAATQIDEDLSRLIERTFRAISQVMLRIVEWVLWLAPLGVLALAIGVGVRLGGSAAGVLAHYVLIVIIACLASVALSYAAAVVFGRASLPRFAKAALPAQVVAVSTQSSLASLPAMIAAARPLDVNETKAGVVLPLAVSLFRAASAAANVAVAVYLAHVHGVELGIASLVVGACVAAAVSVAAVGLPAQVSFFAIIAPVCLAMGVPVTLLPLLLAIETLPDVFRTLGNVTADLAVARIVGREPKEAPAQTEAAQQLG
jgi:Na+/H+-dicarboxylate symporter